MPEIHLKLPIRPHGDQLNVYNARSRFFVGAIGRQYGKSTLALLRFVKRALQRPDIYYWVSPTIQIARQVFQNRFIPGYGGLIEAGGISQTERKARLVGGVLCYFKGADDPDSLRGETIAGCVLDECGTMKSNVWPEIIRPMLAVKKGWCDFIGTPKGRNWFHYLYMSARGMDDWGTHHAPSNSSPFFPQEEFENARATLPDRVFRQEYLAEFLDDDSEVFRGIKDCIRGSLETPQPHRTYLIGCDIAKHVDFTVLTSWDVSRHHLCGYDRFNQIDWVTQEQRIIEMSRRFNNAPIVLDATGVGDPVYDRLVSLGVPVIPVHFSSSVKMALVRSLQLAIEKRDITYPEIPELISELQMYSVEVTPRGNMSYSAPPGYHDDIVMSMALAVSQLSLLPTTGKIELSGSTHMSGFLEV